jgi:outer membrane lipoprotein-sorting protein
MMNGRLILPLLLGLLASPLSSEKLSVDALSEYLNGLRTLQASFTQISADSSLSTGSLYIKRPGRVRFEYDPPNNALVLAAGGQLAIFDPRGNSEPESYPLSKTPLSLILADNVNLSQDRMVAAHEYDGTSTILTVQDPDFPDRGVISLVFTGPQPQLRQWVIQDQNGDQTVVVLNDMMTQLSLSESLFNIFINKQKRNSKD